MSRTSSARFETAVAPTIVVMTANRPERTLKPSHAPTSAPASGAGEADRLRLARPLRVEPGQEDAEADRQPDRERGEQLVVERHRRQRRQRDQRTDEPAAEAENEHVDRADRGARLRAEPAAPPDSQPEHEQRDRRQRPEAEQHGEDDLRQRRLREPGVEVDVVRRVARSVDPAAVEERVHEVRARLRLVAPEVVGVPEAGQDDLVPVRQVRQELPRGGLRRRGEVEVAADQQRLDAASPCTVEYSFSSGLAGQASSSLPPAQTKSVAGLPKLESPAAMRARSSAARSGRRCAPPRRSRP